MPLWTRFSLSTVGVVRCSPTVGLTLSPWLIRPSGAPRGAEPLLPRRYIRSGPRPTTGGGGAAQPTARSRPHRPLHPDRSRSRLLIHGSGLAPRDAGGLALRGDESAGTRPRRRRAGRA